MRRFSSLLCRCSFATLLSALAPTFAHAQSTVVLDVPPLATAGSARAFEFVSFDFRVYLVGIGDPVSDYSANVLANDYENYTYEHAGGGGSGRGGGYHPPHYIRGPAATYSDTYTNVTRPPTKLDALFHFSGADVVGVPFDVAVQDYRSVTRSHSPPIPIRLTPLSRRAHLSRARSTRSSTKRAASMDRKSLSHRCSCPATSIAMALSTRATTSCGAGLGTTYTQADYDIWRTNLGLSYSTASGLAAGTAVPEPVTALLLALALPALCYRRRN